MIHKSHVFGCELFDPKKFLGELWNDPIFIFCTKQLQKHSLLCDTASHWWGPWYRNNIVNAKRRSIIIGKRIVVFIIEFHEAAVNYVVDAQFAISEFLPITDSEKGIVFIKKGAQLIVMSATAKEARSHQPSSFPPTTDGMHNI